MAAWLLCPRQGGNAGQHPFWPRGRVSSLCLSFPMGGAPSPSRSAPGLLAFTRAIFPLQGRSSLMVLGGQFRVLILSVPPNAPPPLPFCPANSYSSGKTQSGLPQTPSPPASASQSHRELRVEPSHTACQLRDPGTSLTLSEPQFPHLQNGNRNPALPRLPRDLRG